MAESIRSYRFLMDSLLRVALPVKGRRGNKCLTVTCGCGGGLLDCYAVLFNLRRQGIADLLLTLIFIGKGLPTYS